MTHVATRSVLIVAVLCLLPRAAFQAGQAVEALRLVPVVAGTTLEQRTLASLGDRDRWGYGYLADVTSLLPPQLYPRVRQATDLPTLQPLLPEYRRQVDTGVLVLVGVEEADVTEQPLPALRRLGAAESGESWTFVLQRSCDRLTRIELQFAAPTPADCELGLLLTDVAHPLGLAGGELRVAAGATQAKWTPESDGKALPLRQTLQDYQLNITYRKGAAVSKASGSAPPPLQIREVKLYGVSVDLQAYETVHADGACLTAIDRGFLEQLIDRDDPHWRHAIERLLRLPRKVTAP